MDDIWTEVALYCDIRARGRLYCARQFLYTPWNDLTYYHLHERAGVHILKACILGEWRTLESRARLLGRCLPYRALTLPSGKVVTAWSPRCDAPDIRLDEHRIRVQFHIHKHADFMVWVRQLCRNRELLHPTTMVASIPRRPTLPILCRHGQVEHRRLDARHFAHTSFRVRLYICDRGCGYPMLFIRCFDLFI